MKESYRYFILVFFIMSLVCLFLIGCENNLAIPKVITNDINPIVNMAKASGNVVLDGGSTIVAKGVCSSLSPTPTIADNKTNEGSGLGSFSSLILNLTPNTKYYVRAYATNSAGKTGYGDIKSITTIDPLNMQTVLIPAGTYIMGAPLSEYSVDGDEYQHQVTLSAFRMSKYEITNYQFAAFLNAKRIGGVFDGGFIGGSNDTLYICTYNDPMGLKYDGSKWISSAGCEYYPIGHITWYAANDYAKYVGGRLPTDEQWEYACRAGTTTAFNTGEDITPNDANFGVDNYYRTEAAVGMYPPNKFGLCDMHGNVAEWCSNEYILRFAEKDYRSFFGPPKVYRGGANGVLKKYCRSAYRDGLHPSEFSKVLGFRVIFDP